MREALWLLALITCSGDPAPAEVAPPSPALRSVEVPRERPPTPLLAVDEEGAAALPWIMMGDPGPGTLPVWVRSGEPAWVEVVAGARPGEAAWRAPLVRTSDETDHAVQIVLSDLPLGEWVHVEARVYPDAEVAPESRDEVSALPRARAVGRIPPTPDEAVDVDLVVMGDLGGQGWCRPVEGGYDIFKGIAELEPDLLVANGDMVYVDGTCAQTDPSGRPVHPMTAPSVADPAVDWTDSETLRTILFSHWRYNHADLALRRLLAQAPLVAQWDDHEVINDFGAAWSHWPPDPDRAGFASLVDEGRSAFRAYSPIPVHPEDPQRIYRQIRYGKHLELFVVDARSYRSPNQLPDSEEVGKRMLGDEQRDWLREALLASDATWKVVSMDVPISVPTGSSAWHLGRDGWASGEGDAGVPSGNTDRSAETGFERVLHGLLWQLDQANLANLVFVTTDVHHAQTIRYAPDLDGDGDQLVFHELISGPLSAWQGQPVPLDPTFEPQSLYAEGGLANASWLRIQTEGTSAVLHTAVVGADGVVRPGSALTLPPAPTLAR